MAGILGIGSGIDIESIVTALEYSPLLQAAPEHAMFHVEHGEITLKKTT